MNEVRRKELDNRRLRHVYAFGDLVGRAGVERMYEQHLRGVTGRERIVVDARGRRKNNEMATELLKDARRIDPLPGHNLVLTLDLDLQRLAERALSRHPSGAAVVSRGQDRTCAGHGLAALLRSQCAHGPFESR